MRQESFPKQDLIDSSKKNLVEEKIWAKAEELAKKREELQKERDALEVKIGQMRSGGLNLHTEQVVAEMESRYWKLGAMLESINEMEKELEAVLGKLESGLLTYSELKLSGLEDDKAGQPQLSKKKAAMREDESRYRKLLFERGITEDDIALDPLFYSLRGAVGPTHSPAGPNEARLTTGRNLKKVKSAAHEEITPLDAERIFYEKTADTHGGKVKPGKSGNTWVSRSGKRIKKH